MGDVLTLPGCRVNGLLEAEDGGVLQDEPFDPFPDEIPDGILPPCVRMAVCRGDTRAGLLTVLRHASKVAGHGHGRYRPEGRKGD